ncbi:hypothetical protein FRC03_010604 [Tulasnella sp. 419]|nr:hypothetical protein FRC03_010604 [Tulasnella sp. 419]
MEWSSVIERHVRKISEKVDLLIKTRVEGEVVAHNWSSSTTSGINSRNQPSINSTTSTESLDWEVSSPLTSVLSGVGAATVSGFSTPVVQSTALSRSPKEKHLELGLEGTSDPKAANLITSPGNSLPLLYRIPQTWRKPRPLKSREELITIAQLAIDFIDNFGAKFPVTWSQKRNFLSAIAIRDKFIQSRCYLNKEPLHGSGDDKVYEHLFLAMYRVYRYYAYQTNWFRYQPEKDWGEHGQSSDSTRAIIKADTDKIQISDHDHYLHLSPSGVPSLLGGLFAPDLEKGHALVSSVRTVLFMTLSSYLAEMTGERKYADIASLGANCIKNWMLDPTTQLIKDCVIDAQTTQERSGAYFSCHLTGITIEGFTVLASVTGEDNWRTLAIEVAKAAMCYEPWHSPEGILTLGKDRATSENTNDKTFKGRVLSLCS